jgi:hypothetical protein
LGHDGQDCQGGLLSSGVGHGAGGAFPLVAPSRPDQEDYLLPQAAQVEQSTARSWVLGLPARTVIRDGG